MKTKQGKKRITITMDAVIINDFRACLSDDGLSAANRIKKWIKDYVDIRNEKDRTYLEDKHSISIPK